MSSIFVVKYNKKGGFVLFSNKIKEVRRVLQLNQTEFAEKLGVSRSIVSEFENNIREPSKEFIIALSKINISLDWFMADKGSMFAEKQSIQKDLLLTKMATKKLKKQPFACQNGHQKAEKTASATERQTDEKMTSQPFDDQNGRQKARNLAFHLPKRPAKGQEPNLSPANASHRQDRNLTYQPEQSDSFAPDPDSGAPNYHTPLPVVHEAADGVVIPLLEQAVSAGRGKALREDDRPALYLNIPSEYGKYGELYALPVRGDSMYPTLDEGDLVVCDSGGWDGDGIYVIKSQDCAFVKRVALSSKGYTVISDNAAYPAYSESKEDIAIVGKVRCAVVRFK